MRRCFPLEIKLIHLLRVLGFDQLGYELELFPEFQNSLLEDGYFPRCPVLEHVGVPQGTNHHLHVLFLIYRIYRVQVHFDWLLPFIVILLIHFPSLNQGGENGVLFRLHISHQ